MEDQKKLKETVEGMRGKNFSDLTKEERDALETMLRNRASKEGRELLWDVRCVWIEQFNKKLSGEVYEERRNFKDTCWP